MHFHQWKRRDLITLLGGAAGASFLWPRAARAQQRMQSVGLMAGGSAISLQRQIAAFRDSLREAGFIEGHNVVLELRLAEGQLERLPALAADLIGRQVAVLVTSTNAGALAAKRATSTIPIVFSVGDDPVRTGLVASLSRPSGNITGVYQFTAGLEAKRLGLLRDLVPKATTIAALIHSSYSGAEEQLRDLQEVAPRLGVELVVVTAKAEADLPLVFASAVQQRAAALLVCASPFFFSRRQQLVLLAARHALPAIYEWRDFPEAGGLMSYGTNLADAYRQAAVYAGRILKGAKPGDLPVVQSTKFELVINLQAAKAIGLTLPDKLLASADEVIE